MGFIVHKSELASEHEKTGAAIISVAESAFKSTPGSEWAKFDSDIRKWLYLNGYRYVAKADDAPKDDPTERLPDEIEIIPVYDSPTRMHVRIPWSGDLAPPPVPKEEVYSDNFKVFLARYFMRKCR